MENKILDSYSIFEFGGKQYQATAGHYLALEKIEAEAGSKVTFDKVLLVKNGNDVKIGQPFVNGAKIEATIVRQAKGPKLVVFKFKRRKRIRTKTGHRQPQTIVKF